MYCTVIKHSSHLRTLEKCRKHSPAARAFYISLVFSNACRVLLQCNTRLRLLYLLNIAGVFPLQCTHSLASSWPHDICVDRCAPPHPLSVGKPDSAFCRTGNFNLTLHGHCLKIRPLSSDWACLPSLSPYSFVPLTAGSFSLTVTISSRNTN